MPGSSRKGKLVTAEWYPAIPNHNKVLDIGPGWGTYSKLLKRKGEIWHALEIHAPYVEKFKLESLYEKVFIDDVRTHEIQGKYDLILCGDVIEHITEAEVKDVFKKVFCSTRYCIISIPLDAETHVDNYNFHDHWENPNEKHLSMWSNKALLKIFTELDVEVIAQEKYEEIAVYLLACATDKPFLNDRKPRPIKTTYYRMTRALSYDPRNSLFSLDGIRNTIAQLIPKSLKPILKKILGTPN